MIARRVSEARLLAEIRKVVGDYADVPPDLADYDWLPVPRYWESVRVPRGERIRPRHEDRHAGVAFRVGWSVPDRVAALWIL
jgi:hypothetical protein